MTAPDRSWRPQLLVGIAAGLVALICWALDRTSLPGAAGVIALVATVVCVVSLGASLWGYVARNR